eukprot:scaffold199066_cov36-Prasinocladus_malaysianus.AAC.1
MALIFISIDIFMIVLLAKIKFWHGADPAAGLSGGMHSRKIQDAPVSAPPAHAQDSVDTSKQHQRHADMLDGQRCPSPGLLEHHPVHPFIARGPLRGRAASGRTALLEDHFDSGGSHRFAQRVHANRRKAGQSQPLGSDFLR